MFEISRQSNLANVLVGNDDDDDDDDDDCGCDLIDGGRRKGMER